MEHISLAFNQVEQHDQLVHEGLCQVGDIKIVTKDKGTDQGNPIAVIAFQVQLPDGSVRSVQATTTVRLLQQTLAGLIGRYGYV